MEIIDMQKWRREKMSYWESNISAMKRVRPDLVDKMLKKRDNMTNGEEFVIEQAKDNSPILGIIKGERKVMLNSTYRPKEEAVKYASKIRLTDNSLTVFFGMGNGMIVSEIMDKLNEEALLFLYEPSLELFCYVIEHYDLGELLSSEQLLLFIEGVNEEDLSNDFSSVLNSINVGVSVMEAHPKYKDLYPEEYVKVKTVFKQCRESAITNLNTIISKNRLMTTNAVLNIPYLFRSKTAADLVGKFPKDMPAIIVSGGPSLDKNYEELKNAKGKALIIAMDRTAKYLLDRGIEPDIFCSLDYSKNTALFEDERLKNIPFLYIPDLSHKVLKTVDSNSLIYGTGDFKLYDWLLEQNNKNHIIIPLGGSVATFAFGFAREMGFRRIILVGQDLALTDGKVYSGGMTNKRAIAEEFDRLMVPGNLVDQIETRGDFYIYLLWFNQAVKDVKGYIEVTNATEGGAKIEGTEVITLKEAIEKYCVSEYDVAEIFNREELIFPEEKREDIYRVLQWKRTEIEALKNKIKKLGEAARRCHVLVERGDLGKEFKKHNKLLSQNGDLFDDNVAAALIYKYSEDVMMKQDMDLYVTEDDDTKEALRLYNKLEYDYGQMYENIDSLMELYDTMLEDCRKELGVNEE